VSAGPEEVIRDEIRALTAYHVQSAEGMVKLDAMENPYRLPDGLRREIGEGCTTEWAWLMPIIVQA